MGWFRFDDRAMDHPKFLCLSDGAFRLWIEGGAYCNRHLTDGFILGAALNGFRYHAAKRVEELTKARLWDAADDGYQMHDYLDWNDSKREIEAKKAAGRERTKKWRHTCVSDSVSDASQHAHIASGVGISTSVLHRKEKEKRDPFVDSDVTERAGRFVDRYCDLYQKHRKAAYLSHPTRDYHAAVEMCATWVDDARLDKLAAIFLTTDHKWASEGSRTIPQFKALASWCDGQLSAWEATKASA